MEYEAREGIIDGVGFTSGSMSVDLQGLDFRIETVDAPASLCITPEMIEAGVSEFYKYDERFAPPEVAAIKIFRAMIVHLPLEVPRSLVLDAEAAVAWSPYL